jgi:8-oxo-dGTP pyrophosphatase MutT (NUDIX family)
MFTPDQIEAALRKPLPGVEAQMRMAPHPVSLSPPAPDHRPRKGGVLLLLYPSDNKDELCLVLTRRTDSVAEHKGQISLPGGSVEPQDSSTSQAAFREACEEIGVCSDDLRVLGSLTPLYVEASDFCIHPYVAYASRRPLFLSQPDEVAELLEVPLRHLLDERNIVVEDWTVRGSPMRVPFFNVHGHKVWGATAVVLAEFLAALSRLDRIEDPTTALDESMGQH